MDFKIPIDCHSMKQNIGNDDILPDQPLYKLIAINHAAGYF
jgi:hypothetical protein